MIEAAAAAVAADLTLRVSSPDGGGGLWGPSALARALTDPRKKEAEAEEEARHHAHAACVK